MVKYAGKDPQHASGLQFGDFVIVKHRPTSDDDRDAKMCEKYHMFIGTYTGNYDGDDRNKYRGVVYMSHRMNNNCGDTKVPIPHWMLELYENVSLSGDDKKELITLLSELREKTSSVSTFNNTTNLLTRLGVEGLQQAASPKY